MKTFTEEILLPGPPDAAIKQDPPCPVFGTCGGCAYQHISYDEELELKARGLKTFLDNNLGLGSEIFESILASPEAYHYRSRIDLSLRRFKDGTLKAGFQRPERHTLVPVEACSIARREITDRIPEVVREASAKLPEDYKTANLVIKTGDDGRVFWGGIGRRSLEMKEADYLWTEIRGVRIFYSLSTFFQANLGILPGLMDRIEETGVIREDCAFLDLYAGVGLFGLSFARKAAKVVMIEECPSSSRIASYNVAYHGLKHVEVRQGKLETEFGPALESAQGLKTVALVDPPRRGLSPRAAAFLCEAGSLLDSLFYLSCHPESLARDLAVFLEKGWRVEKVMPLDFFPRTPHLETLVLMKSPGGGR